MTPRFLQILWLVAGTFFFLALLHTAFNGGAKDAITDWVAPPTSAKSPSANADEKYTSPPPPAHPAPPASQPAPPVTQPSSSADRASLEDWKKTAENAYKKTLVDRKGLLKEWEDWEHMPLFPAVTAIEYGKHPYTIWDLVPATYGCPHEVQRIGRMGDGGKWVCGFSKYEQLPAERKCIIYSFGVRDESSYEEETLTRTGCEIWAYDFSVVDFGAQMTAKNKARAHFMQAGISGKTDPAKNPPFYTIQDLMKMNGHDYLDILKIDIEFAEFESVTSLIGTLPTSTSPLPIGQLLIEIHLFGAKQMNTGTFLKWWETLEQHGMRPAWTEPNLLYSTMGIENKELRLAEYSLINVEDKRNVLFYDAVQSKDAPLASAAQAVPADGVPGAGAGR